MLLDEIKKKAQDFYNKKIIPKLNEAIPNITDKVNEPINAFKIDGNNAKDDELDFDSIEDSPREIATVYGDYKNRNTNTCPHCGHIFDEPPTRGRKCPECGNQFYVRSNNRLFASDLLNPQDVAAADCFSQMYNFGVTIDFAKKIFEDRLKSFGIDPAPRDIIWDIMRKFPDTLSREPLKMAEMASMMNKLVAGYEDDCGRDPRSLLKTSIENNIAYCQIMLAQNEVDQDYLYVSSYCCCDTCRSRHGKKVKIKDAKEKMPIPFKDCQNKRHPKDKYSFCIANYTCSDPKF